MLLTTANFTVAFRMPYFPPSREEPSASDNDESWVLFFAELRRCTSEVTWDLLAVAPGSARQRAVQDFICSLVNAVHGFPDSYLPPPEMRTGVQSIAACLRRFRAGAFRNLAIRAAVRNIIVHVVGIPHGMEQAEQYIEMYMTLS